MFRFLRHSWSWSWWRRRWRGWRGCCSCRQHLTLSWRAILGSHVYRTFIIRRALIAETFQFTLQLAFSLAGGFELRTLGLQFGFFLLGLPLCCLLSTLLLLLLDLALLDLFFEGTQASFLGLFLSLDLLFLPSGFLPEPKSQRHFIIVRMESCNILKLFPLGFLCRLFFSDGLFLALLLCLSRSGSLIRLLGISMPCTICPALT